MTSRAPTIPEATLALLEMLTDAEWPDPAPQVTLSLSNPLDNQVVMIGGGNGSETWAQIGQHRRDETYTVDVAVLVAWPGDTAKQALERAWGLWAVLCASVRKHYALTAETGSGVLWNEIGDLQWTPTIEDDGFGHVITGTVRFRAQT